MTLETTAGVRLATHNSIIVDDPEIELNYKWKQTGSTNFKLTASNTLFNYTDSLKVAVVGM